MWGFRAPKDPDFAKAASSGAFCFRTLGDDATLAQHSKGPRLRPCCGGGAGPLGSRCKRSQGLREALVLEFTVHRSLTRRTRTGKRRRVDQSLRLTAKWWPT